MSGRLADLQHLVYASIAEVDTNGPATRAASAFVNQSPGLSPVAHLQIYRNAIRSTLSRALTSIYPVTRRLVGEQFFGGMAGRFIRQAPSTSPDLADYGYAFPAFVASFEPAEGLPYLADVARLEWCWHRALSSAADPGIDSAVLEQVVERDRPRLVFRLPLSANLLASPFPIHRIWQVNQDDWPGSQEVSLDEGASTLIIWRDGSEMRIDPLSADEWQLLSAIDQGLFFAQLATSHDHLATLLPHCVQQGWVAGFALDESTD